MVCKIANCLCNQFQVKFIYALEKFNTYLNPNIERSKITWRTKTPFPFIREFFSWLTILRLVRRFRENPLAVFIIVQGTIEHCAKALIAGKLAGVKVVSYIPLVYSFSYMRGRIHIIRDLINVWYYNLPDAFIVPIEKQEKILRSRVKRQEIYIIRNPVETLKNLPSDTPSEFFKNAHQEKSLNIAVIGKIHLYTKNHRVLPKVAQQLKKMGKERFMFHIVGDGSHKTRLKQIITAAQLSEHFNFHGWIEHHSLTDFIIKHIDVVLIPSHFETSPNLVLMESVMAGIPVLVSDIPEFKDYVPAEWRFNQRDPQDIARTIASFCTGYDSVNIARMRDFLMARHDPQQFPVQVFSVFNKLVSF